MGGKRFTEKGHWALGILILRTPRVKRVGAPVLFYAVCRIKLEKDRPFGEQKIGHMVDALSLINR
jgi:hypothetical protein